MGWRNFSQWLWNWKGSKLQKYYDDIDAWETPAWVKKYSEKVWDYLSAEMKEELYKFVMVVLKEYDAKFAKQLLQDMLNKLLELLKLRDKD